MILPTSVTQKLEMWNALDAGSARCSSGNTTKAITEQIPRIDQPRGPYSRDKTWSVPVLTPGEGGSEPACIDAASGGFAVLMLRPPCPSARTGPAAGAG